MSATRSAATKAPATDPSWCETTLVLGVHGIRGGPGCAREHGEEDIPALLEGVGKHALYTGPVGVDPMVPDLVLDQIRFAERGGLAA